MQFGQNMTMFVNQVGRNYVVYHWGVDVASLLKTGCWNPNSL